MELKQAIRAISTFNAFVHRIENCPEIKIDHVMMLSKLDKSLGEDIKFARDWLAGKCLLPANDTHTDASKDEPTQVLPVEPAIPTTTNNVEPQFYSSELDVEPYAEWRKINDLNLMVSENGTIYSIEKHNVLEPYFIDGDLRVQIGDDDNDIKRASVLVAKAFQIHSANRNGDYVIAFMDGDRRNLSVSNLYWVSSESRPTSSWSLLLIEDICRRIIEHNGDVDVILTRYKNSKPVVTRNAIIAIINKELHSNISDKFFTVVNNDIVPYGAELNDCQNKPSSSFDVGGFFLTTNDRKTSAALLRDKIKAKQELSLVEKTIIVFITIDIIGGKHLPDVQKISKVVKDQFGVTIPYDIIDQIRNDYNSEVAKMFGR